MKKFSETSKIRLSTCHEDLELIMNTALQYSDIDFGISEGYRSVELQQKYFKEGKSKLDGITKLGKHNEHPSMACDIFIVINENKPYDPEHISYLAGIIHAASEMLFEKGVTRHKVRWGGNWDMDGTILIDQIFDDRPHFELVKV